MSQSKRNEKSKMLSYTTEGPVTIYRIEIICRRYKSTLKCFQYAHRQYGATQHRNHRLPIQSFAHHLRQCRLLQVVALHCCMYGKHLTCQQSVPNWFDVLTVWLLLSLFHSCDYMPHPPNASAREELLLGEEVPLLQWLAEQNCQGSISISCELLEESHMVV